jgi:hypothetical protein
MRGLGCRNSGNRFRVSGLGFNKLRRLLGLCKV